MKTSELIYAKIQEKIHSEEFKRKHSLTKNAFIRNCVLTFSFLVMFILNQLKKSNAAEIGKANTFSEKFKKSFSKSALSKARLKLSPNAFIELNSMVIQEFYKKKSNIKRFCDLIVFAIDGSKFQLPESEDLRFKYGFASNQTGFNMVMGLASQLVDVSVGIILHAVLLPFNSSERDLAMMHINAFLEKRTEIPALHSGIILFDRGYPSTLLIAKLFYNNIHYLMRCNTVFLKEINDFVSSGKMDGIVKINPKKLSKIEREELLNECNGVDFNKEILIRVVVVILDTGEKEILLTSLLDSKKYKYKKFKQFYFMRWGIETIYGLEKVKLEIENFSGKSQIAIEQDFYSSILYVNMTTVLALEAKKELDESGKIKHRKYEYDINYSIAFSYMKNKFMFALSDLTITPKSFCSEIKALMRKHIEPIRPGRRFAHKRKYNKRFSMNTRGVL